MARSTQIQYTSDLSGKKLAENVAAEIRVTPVEGESVYVADLGMNEMNDLFGKDWRDKFTQQGRRGRKAGTAATEGDENGESNES